MKIISHRGLWKSSEEKNTVKSFMKSFSEGFGVETDIRDYQSDLVISHGIPNVNHLKLDTYLKIYKRFSKQKDIGLAFNIKADGLQNMLLKKFEKFNIDNYFVFDMSIPDTFSYIEKNIKLFIRQSEIEKELPFYEEATGVWIDCFYDDWVDEKTIENHLKKSKKVCLVSPELHKRSYQKFWKRLKKMDIVENNDLMICTDFPKIAKEFFYE